MRRSDGGQPVAFKRGFSLLELLIVLVIISILAAKLVPQFFDTQYDVKLNNMRFNEAELRKAIGRYQVEHNGDYPTLSSLRLPQLVAKTNANGVIGTTSDYPYGPYLVEIPVNAMNDKSWVLGTNATNPTLTHVHGWWYNQTTGQIWGGEKELSAGGSK